MVTAVSAAVGRGRVRRPDRLPAHRRLLTLGGRFRCRAHCRPRRARDRGLRPLRAHRRLGSDDRRAVPGRHRLPSPRATSGGLGDARAGRARPARGLDRAGLYAAWSWRSVPGMRLEVVIGLLAVVVLWFGIPILTSHNWFAAGDVASSSGRPGPRQQASPACINRFLGLYEFPMQLAVLVAWPSPHPRRDFRLADPGRSRCALGGGGDRLCLHGLPSQSPLHVRARRPAGRAGRRGVGRLLALAPGWRSSAGWVAAVIGLSR